jgi:hypothetical protein
MKDGKKHGTELRGPQTGVTLFDKLFLGTEKPKGVFDRQDPRR